ncbi:hypothetical protein HDU79_000861 [Rhizoclosmatium sp. JEL0117]|nr:hypothetical protein HDU79_000861 [Rhizoclosmatium sp. JEL0117]
MESYTTQLHRFATSQSLPIPVYSEHSTEGLPHNLRFKMKVTLGSESFDGENWEPKKAKAKDEAARVALNALSKSLSTKPAGSLPPAKVTTTNQSKPSDQSIHNEIATLTSQLSESLDIIAAKDTQLNFYKTQSTHHQHQIKGLQLRIQELEQELETLKKEKHDPPPPRLKSNQIQTTPQLSSSRTQKRTRSQSPTESDSDTLFSTSARSSASTSSSTSKTVVTTSRLKAWPDLLPLLNLSLTDMPTAASKTRASKLASAFVVQYGMRPVYVRSEIVKGKAGQNPFLAVPEELSEEFLGWMVEGGVLDGFNSNSKNSFLGKKGEQESASDRKSGSGGSVTTASTSATISTVADSSDVVAVDAEDEVQNSGNAVTNKQPKSRLMEDSEDDEDKDEEIPLTKKKRNNTGQTSQIDSEVHSKAKMPKIVVKNEATPYEKILKEIMPLYHTLSIEERDAIKAGVSSFLEEVDGGLTKCTIQEQGKSVLVVPGESVSEFKEWLLPELERCFPSLFE